MAHYVSLFSFTEQGVKNFRQSPARAMTFMAAAKKAGLKVRDLFWTMGECDGVLVFEAPNDEAATGLVLSLSSLGNVRTRTMRAFSVADMGALVDKAPKL